MNNWITLFLLAGVSVGSYAQAPSCHLVQGEEEKIYKVCDGERELVPFDYSVYVYTLPVGDHDRKNSLAAMVRIPVQSELRDERYFIFDYRNMEIYDHDCLEGNSAFWDEEEKVIVYRRFHELEFRAFKREDFAHCKQSLAQWSRKQPW